MQRIQLENGYGKQKIFLKKHFIVAENLSFHFFKKTQEGMIKGQKKENHLKNVLNVMRTILKVETKTNANFFKLYRFGILFGYNKKMLYFFCSTHHTSA